MGKEKKEKREKGEKGESKGSRAKHISKADLPEHLEVQRTRVLCGPEQNAYTGTVTSAHAYAGLGVDNSWDLNAFRSSLRIEVTRLTDESVEFDLVGVDPAIANALRRIMISEIPTMAIEHVFFVNNTSIIQDEVLAHRLGLIPILADPSKFATRGKEDLANERNTIVLRLRHRCRTLEGEDARVYSSALEWLPGGSEMPEETSCAFTGSQTEVHPAAIRPVHERILLARLRPGQEIDLEAHCTKGEGQEHAKWSPVATAWYKLLPEVVLRREVMGDDADALAAELPGLVVVQGKGAGRCAEVGDARKHDKLLEKVRRLSGEPRWAGVLELRKVKDHFLFTVETTGVLKATDVFAQAIDVLVAKCDKALQEL